MARASARVARVIDRDDSIATAGHVLSSGVVCSERIAACDHDLQSKRNVDNLTDFFLAVVIWSAVDIQLQRDGHDIAYHIQPVWCDAASHAAAYGDPDWRANGTPRRICLDCRVNELPRNDPTYDAYLDWWRLGILRT